MGRYLKQYDKDYMKMAMLKQEETFRQQVFKLQKKTLPLSLYSHYKPL